MPALDDMPQRKAARAAAQRAHEDAAQHRAAAQATMKEMDELLGVPSRPMAAQQYHGRAGALWGHQSGVGAEPHLQGRGAGSSRLVHALEQYLSLDVPALNALLPKSAQSVPPSAASLLAAAHLSASDDLLLPQTAESLSFSADLTHVHRPDDFIPWEQSPQGKAAAAALAAAQGAPSDVSAKHAPTHHASHRSIDSGAGHFNHSSHASPSPSFEEEEVEEEDHVQQMLRDEAAVRANIASAGQQRRSSTNDRRPYEESLSRVSESDQEQSRSSAGDQSARNSTRAGDLTHRRGGGGGSTTARLLRPSSRQSARTGGAGYDSSMDDAHLQWQDSEEDHSMILSVQPPHELDDPQPRSFSSPQAKAGTSAARPSVAAYNERFNSPRDGSGGARVLSPSATQQRKSPLQVPPPATRAAPSISPRSNRAAELRRGQLQQQQRVGGASSPRSPVRNSGAAPPPRAPAASTTAAPRATSNSKALLSAMERERERRRQNNLYGGMLRASQQQQLVSPRSAGSRPGSAGRGPVASLSPALTRGVTKASTKAGAGFVSDSNDRLMRDAEALMADFRAQVGDVPVDDTADYSHTFDSPRSARRPADTQRAQQQLHPPQQAHAAQYRASSPQATVAYADEFRPDAHAATWQQRLSGSGTGVGVADSYSSSVPYSPPATGTSSEWYVEPRATPSWEDVLADTEEDQHRAAMPPQPNPLDTLSDDDLF